MTEADYAEIKVNDPKQAPRIGFSAAEAAARLLARLESKEAEEKEEFLVVQHRS